MSKQRVEGVICDNCNFEIATVYEKPDGLRELTVHRPVSIAVIDKGKNLGSITCPNCGNIVPTDLGFWARF